MDGRSHDWSSAKRRPRRQVPLTEFYLGQPPNLPKVIQTHDRTDLNTPERSRPFTNTTDHTPERYRTFPNTYRA